MFYTLLKHRKTDPACAWFKLPTGWWSWRRFNRGRGKSCPLCFPRPCPTCTGPIRETTNLVCQRCGHDYGATPDTPTSHTSLT